MNKQKLLLTIPAAGLALSGLLAWKNKPAENAPHWPLMHKKLN